MAGQDNMALMAHLMRRAGFGASRQELEVRVAKGYEATVEELLHPESQPAVDEDLMYRYFPDFEAAGALLTHEGLLGIPDDQYPTAP